MAKLSTLSHRTLGLFSIWAIGVGLVISGESFGWNNGWALLGPKGFMIPVVIITIMYFFLTKILTELACVYPNAEGPHTYANLAFGRVFGDFVAIATLIEFLFATPAIANAIGQYLNFLAPDVFNIKATSIILLILFCLVNLFRINVTAKFMVGLTIVAILELLIFSSSVVTHLNIDNFTYSSFENYTFSNIMQGMPFAIWLYLGLEGVSLLSKNIEKKDYVKSISKGYLYGYITLVVLSFLVLFFAGSAFNWTESTWKGMTVSNDHPLPFVMKLTLGANSAFVQLFTFIGLGGLTASLQGISLASINQINFLASPLIKNSQTKKIITSLIVILIGTVSIWFETTGVLIEVSVFGAVCLYMTSCISLIKLRTKAKTNEIIDNSVQEIEGEKIQSHKNYNSSFSNFYSISVILISIFCVISLVSQHYKYFIYFLVIAVIYILLNNRKTQNGQ
jgi:ethanolamine permease